MPFNCIDFSPFTHSGLEATRSVKLARNAKKKSAVTVCVLAFVHGWKMNNNFFIWLPWKGRKTERKTSLHDAEILERKISSFPLHSSQISRLDWGITKVPTLNIFSNLWYFSLNIIYGRTFFSQLLSSWTALEPSRRLITQIIYGLLSGSVAECLSSWRDLFASMYEFKSLFDDNWLMDSARFANCWIC